MYAAGCYIVGTEHAECASDLGIEGGKQHQRAYIDGKQRGCGGCAVRCATSFQHDIWTKAHAERKSFEGTLHCYPLSWFQQVYHTHHKLGKQGTCWYCWYSRQHTDDH